MDPAFIKEYASYERRHWWFAARSQMIRDVLDRYVPGAADHKGRWLDVGCGTGVLIEAYSGFAEKVGAEIDAGCVEIARAGGLDVRQTGVDWDFSQFGEFDCVSLCDVLEHVEHEQPAINAVRKVLKDDGILLITVPALMSLWSDHDAINHHFRRYRREELLSRFPADQWQVLKVSYFSTMLFPAIWTVRQCKRMVKLLSPSKSSKPKPPRHDLRFGNPLVDGTLRNIFSLERPLLKRMSLPIGSSLLLILQKKNSG